jgi:poly(hydroxyalkanoate) depolymerase family esterase
MLQCSKAMDASMTAFLRKILAATRLTQQGKLIEATAAIQRALAPSMEAHTHAPSPAPRSETVVVDASGDDAATTIDADPDVIEEVRPATIPASGAGRFVASSFTGADGTRTFKLFVPAGFDGEALPLVVMLHGCGQDPDDFAAGTRMNVLAQAQGLIVLYPAQAPRSNAHKCWNWFSPRDQRRGSGEPALLAGMTRHVLQTHSVDRNRVYVAGLSAGGAMAAILAREYPDVFAAAGIHSGVAPGTAHDVQSAFAVMKSGPDRVDSSAALLATLRPATTAATTSSSPGAPLIVFHGDADRTVVAANGDTVVAAALGEAGVVATTGHGATGARSYRRTVWRRTDAGAEAPSLAEHWVVHGGGHAWSGGSAAGSFADPEGPDATREMLRFFAEHPRRGSPGSGDNDQTNV